MVRKSYVDTLKTSKNYDHIVNNNVFLKEQERGHTLDVNINRNRSKSPIRKQNQSLSKYAPYRPKQSARKRAKSNKIVNRSMRKNASCL